MKLKILSISLLAILVLSGATITTKVQSDLADKLIGTWIWKTVIDSETKQDLGLDMVTMGIASEVRTEFKRDNTYTESKLRKGSSEYSYINGEWKIENNETLNLKAKDKWMPSKILKISNDSILLQMNSKLTLLMVKQK
ncbi:MAG: lipocalin family protein [Sporocytophaga sp.]|nr:lipocalin family protein [Sporocytophaga sp.]